MDMNLLRGIMTVFWMLAFLGIVWWAWHPRTRKRFDEAARLPIDDDASSAVIKHTSNGEHPQ